AGIGLRLPHLAAAAAGAPLAGWVEIHPENFLANPHARELLLAVRQRSAVAFHTVGVSAGSADGVDREHLARLAALASELEPFAISGHLAWSTHRGLYLNDLLPLPYDDDTLAIVAANVHEIQDTLGRPYIVENPASYVAFGSSTIAEAEFLAELVHRTGCRLLCDVSNVHVSASNLGYDAYAYLDAFPARAVAELHMGGFTAEAEEGAQVLIDTHDGPIADTVLELYAHALRRFGAQPTLIEWDSALPDLDALLNEAARADEAAFAALAGDAAHAAAR
ncbi:MAG TPA: DUF692 domain-containing protein, partial [Gammaproteobacteria bacterium]|nr:DUF692 domain-containing protein [Gammaproteobacteria bacterium]